EAGIRDCHVTGVQTCALPIWPPSLQTSTLDAGSAASSTTFDTMPSANPDPSLPAAPTPGSSKKEAFRSAYGQALRLSRRKLLKQDRKSVVEGKSGGSRGRRTP